MSKYTKIRRIQKGQLGLEFGVTDTSNSTLTQTAQDAVNNQINQNTQGIRNQIYLKQLLGGYQSISPFIYGGLTNFGIMSGNATMANLGQLGNSLNNGIQLAQNWKGLSKQDKVTGVAGIAGQAADTLDNMFFSKQHANDSGLTKGLNNAYDSISNAAMMFSPVGTVLGGAMKAGKLLGDGLTALVGGGTDQLTTTDKIMDSTLGRLSGLGLINSLGSKRTKDFSLNKDTIEKVGGSYAGAVNTMEEAASKAGKKVGLFSGTSGFNKLIGKAQTFTNQTTRIANTYQDQLANKSDLAYTRYVQDINGGPQQYIQRVKHGAILQRINLRKHRKGGVLSNQLHSKINLETQEVEWKPVININQETPEFKEGGELVNNQETIQETNSVWQPNINLETIQIMEEGGRTDKPKQESDKIEETNQKNVIPEGALHAHKHHMENAEDLTKKGIPVVDNKGEQQAEIEREELILSLEVTKQLENLYKRYQEDTNTQQEKDELAIEAGKLLVYEILHNTIDRTGLIKECKKGGTLDENQ